MKLAATTSFALALTGLSFSSASALPIHAGGPLAGTRIGIERIDLECNRSRCIDTETGFYGESTCNARGCFPLGGAVGRTQPPDRYQERRAPRGAVITFGAPGYFVRTLPPVDRVVQFRGAPCQVTVTRRVNYRGEVIETERRRCPGGPGRRY